MSSTGTIRDEDWLDHAKPIIEARMAEYEEGQIEFGILSLVKDPLFDLIPALAENLKVLSVVSARLDNLRPDWRENDSETSTRTDTPSEAISTEFDGGAALTPAAIESATIPEAIKQQLESRNVDDLLTFRQQLLTLEAQIRTSIRGEQQACSSDDDRAASRRHDYGPVVQSWVRMLAEKRMVQPLLDATTNR